MTRKLIKSFQLVAWVFTSSVSCLNAESTAESARQILGKSIERMSSLDSSETKALEEGKNGRKKHTTILTKVRPDGARLERIEIVSFKKDDSDLQKPGAKFVMINNAEGSWVMIEGKRIALDARFMQNTEMAKKLAEDDFWKRIESSQSEFSVSQVIFLERECWKVTQKLDPSNDALIQDFLTALTGKKTVRNEEMLPRILVYYIGKEDFLTYSREVYSHSMSLIQRTKFDSIQAGLPLADHLFEIPQGVKKVRPKDQADFQAQFLELLMST